MLWDFAGVDGLAVAMTLFGQPVQKLAVWRSLVTPDSNYAILRLCQGNFRIRTINNDLDFPRKLAQACSNQRVWYDQLTYVAEMSCPSDVMLHRLEQIALPKPPFRLQNLPLNAALPARINGTAMLIWRYFWQGTDLVQLHCAQGDVQKIRVCLPDFSTMA